MSTFRQYKGVGAGVPDGPFPSAVYATFPCGFCADLRDGSPVPYGNSRIFYNICVELNTAAQRQTMIKNATMPTENLYNPDCAPAFTSAE